MEWTQCHDHLVLSRELLLMNQNSGSFVRKFGVSRGDVIQQQTERNSLSFTTFISLFNESICRASLNEHISNSFPLFRFCVQSNSTQSVYLVGLKILFSRLSCSHASVVKMEHRLKLKIFAPQRPFSIHSSCGMETSVVTKIFVA